MFCPTSDQGQCYSNLTRKLDKERNYTCISFPPSNQDLDPNVMICLYPCHEFKSQGQLCCWLSSTSEMQFWTSQLRQFLYKPQEKHISVNENFLDLPFAHFLVLCSASKYMKRHIWEQIGKAEPGTHQSTANSMIWVWYIFPITIKPDFFLASHSIERKV